MRLKDLNRLDLPRTELCSIGYKHKTDKPNHGYTKIYYEIMKDVKNDPINFFEIGIFFGASLKMWYEFFPKGNIYGIDNGRLLPNANIFYSKSNEIPSPDDIKLLQFNATIDPSYNFKWLENDRTKGFVADQRSLEDLNKSFGYFNCNEFDFILDDGQHYMEHQQKSLGLLFPTVKSGGYYIIEDVIDQKSLLVGCYWGQRKKNGSDSTDIVFTKFLETGILESIYMTSEEIEYIKNNIEDIFLYDCKDEFQTNIPTGSPVEGPGKLLIIKKK